MSCLLAALLAGWPLVLLAGCSREETELVSRDHRFGIFRDLKLFQRPAAEGGPFFLDRFESTEADFHTFLTGSVDPDRYPNTRPRTRIDLHTARRFARFRFGRVMRADEFDYACTQAGSYVFPWGVTFVDTYANTGEIGLGRTTPVGSFASGGGRSGPFDLVGNVAEWTETVPVPFVHVTKHIRTVERVIGLPEWPSFDPPASTDLPYERYGEMPFGLRMWLPLWVPMPRQWLHGGGRVESFRQPEEVPAGLRAWLPRWLPAPWQWIDGGRNRDEPLFGFTEVRPVVVEEETQDMPGVDRYRRTPGLRCWVPGWIPAPTDWLVELESESLPRLVLGGHFRSLVPDKSKLPQALEWTPSRYGPTTGVRVAADPDGLLTALLEFTGPLSPAARSTLGRFLREPTHHGVLAASWPRVRDRVPGGALRRFLTEVFGE